MNHIISSVKKGLLKAGNTVTETFSEAKSSISKTVTKATRRSRSRITMQHAAGRQARRYVTRKVNQKRFTVVVAIAVVAVMVPVMVMAANGDTAQVAADDLQTAVQIADYTVNETEAQTQTASVPELTEETTEAATIEESVVVENEDTDAAEVETAAGETKEEVAPEPTPEPTPQYINLTEGVTDASVATLQQRLMELHYMSEDQPTEYFGPATLKAVQAFQRKNGLTIDGAAGPETQALIFSDSAKEYSAALGAEGDDVWEIQERLQELGYDVSVTGYFGEATEAAVKYFQRMNGLDDDGSVGNMTKDKLFSDNAEPSEQFTQDQEEKEESSGSSGGSSSGGSSSGSSNSGGSSSSGGGSSSGGSAPAADPGNVEAFIDAALAQVGKPYVLGGKGPNSFDCSGFVYYALKQSGNGIGYMTSGGWASSGYTSVSWDNLQRGDIVCVSGHVGIYLGGGQIVDASSSSGQIVVRSMGSWFADRFICGKRVL